MNKAHFSRVSSTAWRKLSCSLVSRFLSSCLINPDIASTPSQSSNSKDWISSDISKNLDGNEFHIVGLSSFFQFLVRKNRKVTQPSNVYTLGVYYLPLIQEGLSALNLEIKLKFRCNNFSLKALCITHLPINFMLRFFLMEAQRRNIRDFTSVRNDPSSPISVPPPILGFPEGPPRTQGAARQSASLL